MMNPLKSINLSAAIPWLLLVILAGWFKSDSLSWRDQRRKLEEDLATADSIIHQYDTIIHTAQMIRDRHQLQYDSITKKRYENDTSTYMYSADSLSRLWAERYSH